MATWGRIEARSYDEAIELLEKLSQHPAALVQDGERRWSIYVSADASALPTVVLGAGVDPKRIEVVEGPEELGFSAEPQRAEARD